MPQRIDYQKQAPDLFKEFVDFSYAISKSSITIPAH
jgi:hypothetical protein